MTRFLKSGYASICLRDVQHEIWKRSCNAGKMILKLRNEVGVFLFNTSCPIEADYSTSTLEGVTHSSFVHERSIYCQIRLDKGNGPLHTMRYKHEVRKVSV